MILGYSTPPQVHFDTKNQIIHVRPSDKPSFSFYLISYVVRKEPTYLSLNKLDFWKLSFMNFFFSRLISYDILRAQTKFCPNSTILRRHNIALHLLNKNCTVSHKKIRLPCYLLWTYMKDLVLDVKVDLSRCTMH
jgi:hypothetical protein